MNQTLLASLLLAGGLGFAQADRPFHIQKLDPALDEIIAPPGQCRH